MESTSKLAENCKAVILIKKFENGLIYTVTVKLQKNFKRIWEIVSEYHILPDLKSAV